MIQNNTASIIIRQGGNIIKWMPRGRPNTSTRVVIHSTTFNLSVYLQFSRCPKVTYIYGNIFIINPNETR